MADQQQVSRDQQSVQSAETALAQILSTESAAASKTGSPSGAPTGSSSGTGKGFSGSSGSSSKGFSGSSGSSSKGFSGSGGSSSKGSGSKGFTGSGGSSSASGTSKGFSGSGGQGGSSSTPTTAATDSAAQLASDQATIDSDQANLVSAQQSLANGTLKAPMAGTVAAVTVSAGQSVSAGSTSSAITITDPGSYQTSSSLTSSQVGEVATGDHVQVSIDGQSGSYSGTVTQVGPADPGSSGYTFPLVVALSPGSLSPGTTVAGSTAQVTVDIAQASHTVVVPTSAVHSTAAGRAYVITLKSGREVDTSVKVGVVGDVYTQITSGLSAGTQVVLADNGTPVPSSSSNPTNTFRGFGGAGLGGAGGFAGGAAFARSSLG